LQLVETYCPLINEWRWLLRDDDAIDISLATEILHYYSTFSIQHSLLDRARDVLEQLCEQYPFAYEATPIPSGLDEWIGLGSPGYGPYYLRSSPEIACSFLIPVVMDCTIHSWQRTGASMKNRP